MTKSNIMTIAGGFTIATQADPDTPLFSVDADCTSDIKLINSMLRGEMDYGDNRLTDRLAETIEDNLADATPLAVTTDKYETMLAIGCVILRGVKHHFAAGNIALDDAAEIVTFTNTADGHKFSMEDVYDALRLQATTTQLH
jgi:hypothetical protein